MDSANESVIGLYQLFSRLLAEELTAETIAQLQNPELISILEKAEPEISTYLNDVDLESAAVAYCDLFVLPGKQHCSARAIAWVNEGSEISADGIHAVVDVFLKTHSIELPPPISGLTHDHAATLFYLAAQLRQLNSPQVEEFEQTIINSWVPNLAQKLSRGDSPLYRALGKLMRAHLVPG